MAAGGDAHQDAEDVPLEIVHAGGGRARIDQLADERILRRAQHLQVARVGAVEVELVPRRAVLELIAHLVVDADSHEQLSLGFDSHKTLGTLASGTKERQTWPAGRCTCCAAWT